MSTMYTTNSQLASTPTNNPCPHDLLYAFPAAIASPPPKENHYYANSTYNEPTMCHNNEMVNDIQILRPSDLYQFETAVNEINNMNLNVNNNPNSVFGDGPQFYIAVNRPATAEQLERVVNNINLTLSACRKQQSNCRPKLSTVFHTMRRPPANFNNVNSTNVTDLFRQKLSEVTFVPPSSQTNEINNTCQAQLRSSSPTPSELFSFDDDDDDDYIETENQQNNNSQQYFSSSYSNASTQQQEPTARYDDENETDYSAIPPTSIYAVSNVIAAREQASKIYDLPPDAAAKMNENLAKVLLKQIAVAHENVYEVPCPDSSLDISDSTNLQEKVLLGNGVEIVHTYC